jgi:hypothetical protein
MALLRVTSIQEVKILMQRGSRRRTENIAFLEVLLEPITD